MTQGQLLSIKKVDLILNQSENASLKLCRFPRPPGAARSMATSSDRALPSTRTRSASATASSTSCVIRNAVKPCCVHILSMKSPAQSRFRAARSSEQSGPATSQSLLPEGPGYGRQQKGPLDRRRCVFRQLSGYLPITSSASSRGPGIGSIVMAQDLAVTGTRHAEQAVNGECRWLARLFPQVGVASPRSLTVRSMRSRPSPGHCSVPGPSRSAARRCGPYAGAVPRRARRARQRGGRFGGMGRAGG